MAHTISLREAVMTVFHASCPRVHIYMENNERVASINPNNVTEEWQRRFYADLLIWQSSIVATWLTLTPTHHDAACRCCINFRFLCSNYESDFQRRLGDDYELRRVSRASIVRWAETIRLEGVQRALEEVRRIAFAVLTGTKDPGLLDISSDSENLSTVSTPDTSDVSSSDTTDDKTDLEYRPRVKTTPPKTKKRRLLLSAREVEHANRGIISTTGVMAMPHSSKATTSVKETHGYELRSRSVSPRVRKRKTLRRPLSTYVELDSLPNTITIADTSIWKAISIKIECEPSTRSQIVDYIKHLLHQVSASYQMYGQFKIMDHKHRMRTLTQEERQYAKAREKFEQRPNMSLGLTLRQDKRRN